MELETSPDRFLGELADNRRRLALKFLVSGDIDSLDTLMGVSNAAAREAYEAWKESSVKSQEPSFLDAAQYTAPSCQQKQQQTTTAMSAFVRKSPIPQHLPERTNILLLGETGVGKSTLINALANYWLNQNIDQALEKGPTVLVDTKFSITNANYVDNDITALAGNGNSNISNEVLQTGQSSTQDPKAYTFKYGAREQSKYITLIDCPGMGDVRGIDQDSKNMNKILSFISQFDNIHAICVLMKPNKARMSITFRFCVDELLRHLHRSASKNIMFCFTNSRGTNYRPGDSLSTLRQHLTNLSQTRNIQIDLNRYSRNTMFCFDNEPFRYLCAQHMGKVKFTDEQKESFAKSWIQSVDEVHRMFNIIGELPPHRICETMSINSTRQAILKLSLPLAEINRNLISNINRCEAKQEEIEQLLRDRQDLRGRLHVNTSVILLREAEHPQTVCAAECCVEYRRVGTDRNGLMEKIYRTVCHEDCQLNQVHEGAMPNPILQHCLALRENIEDCEQCGCSWDKHIHIRYKIKEELVKMIDNDIQQQVKDNNCQALEAAKFLKNLKRAGSFLISARILQIMQLKGEHTQINKYSTEFSAYLNDNSILPYNDCFAEYLDYLIQEEISKSNITGNTELVELMKQHLVEYGNAVEVLRTNLHSMPSTRRGIVEINEMLQKLQRMDRFKDLLQDISNLELNSSTYQRHRTEFTIEIPDMA